ncbi:MAG: hypothetical protein ACMG6E_06945 [Candidatus Roizmanbacteria bacterium]
MAEIPEKVYSQEELAAIAKAFDDAQQSKMFLNLQDLTLTAFEDQDLGPAIEYDLDDRVLGTSEQLKHWFNSLRQQVENFNVALKERFDGFAEVPKDVLVNKILYELSLSELHAACMINKRMAFLCHDDNFWFGYAKRKLDPKTLALKPDSMSWHEFMIEVDNGGLTTLYFMFSPDNVYQVRMMGVDEFMNIDEEIPFHPAGWTSIPYDNTIWKFAIPIFAIKGDGIPVRFAVIYRKEDAAIEVLVLGDDEESAREELIQIQNNLNMPTLDASEDQLEAYFSMNVNQKTMILEESSEDYYLYLVKTVVYEAADRFVLNRLTNRYVKVGGKTWLKAIARGDIFLGDKVIKKKSTNTKRKK